MSRLIRCDRCGKTLGTQEATYIIWPQAVDRYNRDFPVRCEQIYEKENRYDYCEECAEAVLDFLHQKPTEENPPNEKIMVEKYYNENGDLGILISAGFGAGWSTWNCEEIAYDKRIIEYWLDKNPSESEMKEFLESLGYKDVCMEGYSDLGIEYIPKGTMFCIREYDGKESIETPRTICMMIA